METRIMCSMKKIMRRHREELNRRITKFIEAMEEAGLLEKETQVEGGRNPLEEDLYDIKEIKRLERSPTLLTASVEKDIPIRPMQETETHRSQDITVPSPCDWVLSPFPLCELSFSVLAMEEETDGRRSFVPVVTGSHQVSIQYWEPEPTPVSVKERGMILRKNSTFHFAASLGHTVPCAFLLNKPAETQKTEGRMMLETAAVSPTRARTSHPIKPAETQRSDRRQTPVADEQQHSLSSEHQETYKTEKAQRQRPVIGDGSNRSFFPLFLLGRHAGSGRAAALALSFLMFAPMMCSPVAGSLCGEKKEVVGMAVHKGEVVLDCPVTVDVHQTKHSVLITYVDLPTTHEEVLGCDWLTDLKNFDCLVSRYGAKLIEIRNDSVLATLPEDRLQHNGSYQCKLAPAGIDERFPDCDICYPPDPTTDPQNRADAPSDGHTGLVTAVVFLSIIVLLLLLMLVGLGFLYFKLKMHRGRNRTGGPAGENNALNEQDVL